MTVDYSQFPILKNEPHCVAFETYSGKPNPKQSASVCGEFRGRVVKSPKPCGEWYDGLGKLRKRIGPNHPPELLEARLVEKQFSHIRKRMATIFDMMHFIATGSVNPIIKSLLTQDVEGCKQQLGHWNTSPILIMDDCPSTSLKRYFPIKVPVEAYVKDPKGEATLVDYLKSQINSFFEERVQFLKSLNVDPEIIYQDMILKRVHKYPSWGQLDSRMKGVVVNLIITLEAGKRYGLKMAEWTPRDGVKGLIESLRIHGPHMFAGFFGTALYKDAPFRLQVKHGERDVYGWKKGAKRVEPSGHGNTVLVIGAIEEGEKSYVNFEASSDVSDPNKPNKIYRMSYERFLESMGTLYGVQDKDVAGPFAFHR